LTGSHRTELQMMLSQLFKFLLKLGLILLITLVLLELVAQVIWWQRDCIVLSGKELCLLPDPLLTGTHLEILNHLEQAEKEHSNFDQFDPVLGWSIRPGSQTVENGTLYESNDIGVRARRTYSPTPPAGITRIAVFGPSFAHADDVALEDAWTYLMEQSQPELEVMNWGVGGYGTDQAYLLYTTQGARYASHVVIIAYEEDNLRRNVNRYRPFVHPATGIPLTKPVFVLDGDGLQLLENPFHDMATLRKTAMSAPDHFLDVACPHDFFCVRERYQPSPFDFLKSYRFLRTLAFQIRHRGNLPYLSTWRDSYSDPLQTEVTYRLLRMFAETAQRNGSTPVVVMFAYRVTMEEYAAGKPPMYDGISNRLRSAGVRVLDLTPEFVKANHGSTDFTGFFAPGGHYNEVGNRVVSRAVVTYLCQEKMLSRCSVSQ
jgi:hypothetical protein